MNDDEHDSPAFSPADDAEAWGPILENPTQTNPLVIAKIFCDALVDPLRARAVLDTLTTPESREAWGDYTDAARAVRELGFVMRATHPLEDDLATPALDVAHVRLPRGVVVDESVRVSAAVGVMMQGLYLTLVWDPEVESWRIHHLGEPLRPEDCPRAV